MRMGAEAALLHAPCSAVHCLLAAVLPSYCAPGDPASAPVPKVQARSARTGTDMYLVGIELRGGLGLPAAAARLGGNCTAIFFMSAAVMMYT